MKVIQHDNWLQADAVGQVQVVESRVWRQAFLEISLDPAVSPDVVNLFEAARGSMLYGYFFHPLLSTGVELCYRVLESGARARCAQMGLPVYCNDSRGKAHPLSFGHNLSILAKQGVIQDTDLTLWRQARELREWVATPEHQSGLTLNHAVTALSRAAELLGRLFQAPLKR